MTMRGVYIICILLGMCAVGCQEGQAIKRSPVTGFPVMPNSVFQPLVSAVPVPTSPSGPVAIEGLVHQHGSYPLIGVWKYKADPAAAGESDSVPWYSPSLDDSGWATMPVPSNYSIEDPSLADFYKPVWFRREFTVPENMIASSVHIVFDGVDYFVRVWLNGDLLGDHEGYFAPFEFDVTGKLREGGNVLTVKVINPYDYAISRTGSGPLLALSEKIWIKGILDFHDCRPGDSLGAAESQSMGTGGIWGGVSLVSSGPVRINRAYVTPELSGDNSRAVVHYRIFLTNSAAGSTLVTITAVLRGDTFSMKERAVARSVLLGPGTSSVDMSVVVPNPRLWWPWDHPELGNPDLYRADISVTEGGECSDEQSERFGIRSVRMSEQGDNAYIWTINGKRMFMRGTNIIPTEWFSRADRVFYLRDAALLKGAGITMVRVHASLHPLLYDVFDEAGIAVYQDFPLQWEYNICDFERPNGDPTLTNNVRVIKRMMAEMIYAFFNHPSIFLWNIHNEPVWAASSFIGIPVTEFPSAPCKSSPYTEGDVVRAFDGSLNRTLDDSLFALALAVDSTRPIHKGSGFGDTHIYDGWYAGVYTDLSSIPAAAFPTEYGAQGVPYSAEEWMQAELGPGFWPLDTPDKQRAWHFHDFQNGNQGVYIGRSQGCYTTFSTWAFASQLYQAVVNKYDVEWYRSHRYAPTGGSLQFDFQDWWPSVTWGLVDHNREKLLAYDWFAKANSPVHIAIPYRKNILSSEEGTTLTLTVINDTYTVFPQASLTWAIVEETDSFLIKGDPGAAADDVIPAIFLGSAPHALTATRGTGRVISNIGNWSMTTDIQADAGLTVSIPFAEPVTTGARHFGLYATLTAFDGSVLADNRHHILVVPDAGGFYDQAPGCLTLFTSATSFTRDVRFDLSIIVTGASGLTITSQRKYGTDPTVTTIIPGNQLSLTGLLPGIYTLTFSQGTLSCRQEVALNSSLTLTVDLPSCAD